MNYFSHCVGASVAALRALHINEFLVCELNNRVMGRSSGLPTRRRVSERPSQISTVQLPTTNICRTSWRERIMP
jgi:hypothetical protein